MMTWPEERDGVEILVRKGTGIVTNVNPVGTSADDGATYAKYQVEIMIDPPETRKRAIRYCAHPIITSDSPLYAAAIEALRSESQIEWRIEWHRHDWMPTDIPIGAMNLVTDARSVLTELRLLDPLPDPESIEIPDEIPAWMQ
jgi:hypothetical protein